MRALAIILFASSAFAQSCPHTLTRTPVGPVLLYQNGKLLNVGDYSSVTPAGKTMPTLTPLVFADQDLMSVVITRAVPLTFTTGTNQSVTYFSYALWREDWTCTGSTGLPNGVILLGNSSGAFGFAAGDTSSAIVILLSPSGDGTGKQLGNAGVVPCPRFDPKVSVLNPTCYQLVWSTIP